MPEPQLGAMLGITTHSPNYSKVRILGRVRSEHLLKLFWSNTFRREMRGVFFFRTMQVNEPNYHKKNLYQPK